MVRGRKTLVKQRTIYSLEGKERVGERERERNRERQTKRETRIEN